MHASGQAHLLHLSRGFPLFDLGLEPFSVTAADADCYYVALGGEKGALALQFIALPGDNCRKYESRIAFSFKYIKFAVKNFVRAFEVASLEAYMQTPIMAKRPELVR